jgi:hypothetical protein
MELTPEQKFSAEDPERIVARSLIAQRSREDIIAELVRLDWSRVAAESLIERIANDLVQFHSSPEHRALLIRSCRRQAILGFALAATGIFLTAVSALGALFGVHLFIFTGLIITGLVLGTRSLSRWRMYRKGVLTSK